MSFREPEIDPEFEGLRQAHRSEAAPDALRRRVLAARAKSAPVNRPISREPSARARRWLLALAAAAAGVAALAVFWSGPGGKAADALVVSSDDMVPSVEPGGAPRTVARCQKPLPAPRWNPTDIDQGAKVTGLEAAAFEQDTDGCGPLTRRYLVRMPAGDAASAPLLIVLHAGGQSAEQAQVQTRWWFDDLARREQAVLVYANGAPGSIDATTWVNAGVWQTDEGAHPAVDDFEYLHSIVADLRAHRGLGPSGDVFLAGYGSGGVMALAAAQRHPERYSAVAAFVPGRSPSPRELDGPAPAAPSERRLRAVFVVLPDAPGPNGDASSVARQWAVGAHAELSDVRVTRPKPGFERIDASLADAVALRVLRLSRDIEVFPGPGGSDPLARAASERRPWFFDAPGEAWAFFRSNSPGTGVE